MFHIFDIVWCKNARQVFSPGAIMLDPKKQLWQNNDLFFVKHFLDGSGKMSSGKWHHHKDICLFLKTKLPEYTDKKLEAIVLYASSFDLRKSFSVTVVPLKDTEIEQGSTVKKVPAKRDPRQNISAPTTVRKRANPEGPSEFEKIAQKNRDILNQLLKPLMEKSSELSSAISAPTSVVRRSFVPKPRSIIPYSKRDEPVVTRSRNSSTQSNASSIPVSPISKKIKRQPIARRSMPSRWTMNPNSNVLSPEEITQTMLDKVCDNVLDKVYMCSGTTCHQCRQKTADTKTVCRSGHCSGVRGQFCGVCLYNRYGENAREALKNPTWKCPPCRGVCNCSICRNYEGKCATGPAFYTARAKGFESVMHYLAAKEGDIEIDGSEGDSPDNEKIDDEEVNGEKVNGEIVNGEIVDGEKVNGERVNGEKVDLEAEIVKPQESSCSLS